MVILQIKTGTCHTIRMKALSYLTLETILGSTVNLGYHRESSGEAAALGAGIVIIITAVTVKVAAVMVLA